MVGSKRAARHDFSDNIYFKFVSLRWGLSLFCKHENVTNVKDMQASSVLVPAESVIINLFPSLIEQVKQVHELIIHIKDAARPPFLFISKQLQRSHVLQNIYY